MMDEAAWAVGDYATSNGEVEYPNVWHGFGRELAWLMGLLLVVVFIDVLTWPVRWVWKAVRR